MDVTKRVYRTVRGRTAAKHAEHAGAAVASSMIRTAILTVSDGPPGAPRGADAPQPSSAASAALDALRSTLAGGDFEEVDHAVVPCEQARIRAQLRIWADSDHADLVVTTGGVGLELRDRTPEATADVVERVVPGLDQLMRAAWLERDAVAASQWRGTAGVRSGTLIVNAPGDAAGVAVTLGAAREAVAAAVRVLQSSPATSTPD